MNSTTKPGVTAAQKGTTPANRETFVEWADRIAAELAPLSLREIYDRAYHLRRELLTNYGGVR